MNDWRKNLAINLKAYRKAWGWSQDKLAEKANCSKSVIRDLEVEKGSASMDMLSKIADAMNMKVDTLIYSGEVPALSQPQINTIAKDATLHSLASIILDSLNSFPEDVLELGRRFDSRDEVWKSVSEVMHHRLASIAKENLKANG